MDQDVTGLGGRGDGWQPSAPGGSSGPGEIGMGSPGLSNNSATPGSSGSGWSPLSALPAVGSSIASYLSGMNTNDENSAEAAKNRMYASLEAEQSRRYDAEKTQWQATHGYQNAVADMRSAGLNPAMMYAGKGGSESGTGGGGSAASAPGNPIHTNAIAQGLNSAMQAYSTMNDIRNSDADIRLKDAQSLTQAAQAQREQSAAMNLDEDTHNLAMRSRQMGAEYKAVRAESDARVNKASIDIQNDARDRLLNQIGTGVGAFTSATGGIGNILKGTTRTNPALPGGYGMWNKRTGEIYQ